MRPLRQVRVAELVAAALRNDILDGVLGEGAVLPTQEQLIEEFGVSMPAVREAMRILESEGLVTVRRGNVGGAVVHLPTPERTARMIGMVMQSRGTSLGDVSGALLLLEPVCASLCAARQDRATEVVPALRALVDRQREVVEDRAAYNTLAREFHEAIVALSGNETMIIVIGALESLWSAHESSVWGEPVTHTSEDVTARRQAALSDHERLLSAIEAGDENRAATLSSVHLTATRATSLASSEHDKVSAQLLDGISATTLARVESARRRSSTR
jgi:GntR family transcriptional repressor for pyruvate dehydrogenase complex